MFNLVYSNHRLTFGNANVGFEEPNASITYSIVEHGTVTGVATAQIGSTVTVTATPSTGYVLSYITVNGTQIVGNSFVVTGNTVVGAVFVEIDEVTIGNQVWKTHNLAINDNGGGIIVSNGEYYYSQDAAIRVAATVTGWHLPSTEEFNTLITNAGGFNGLASTETWTYGGGDNSSGFNALAKGYIFTIAGGNDPLKVGTNATYWSSNTSNRYSMSLNHNSDSTGAVDVGRGAANHATVRLIKD